MRGENNFKAQLRTTVDKREIKDFSKLPSATSFIRKPLHEIAHSSIWGIKYERLTSSF